MLLQLLQNPDRESRARHVAAILDVLGRRLPSDDCARRLIDAGELLRKRYATGAQRDEAMEILTALAEALDYVHEHGLLHRDVKPANVLLTQPTTGSRRILLADFGIARQLDYISGLTATNMTVCTASHAAPAAANLCTDSCFPVKAIAGGERRPVSWLGCCAQRRLDKLRQQLAQHIWMSRGEWLYQHLTQVDIVNCGIPLARTVAVPETGPGGAVSGYTHRLAKHSVLSA